MKKQIILGILLNLIKNDNCFNNCSGNGICDPYIQKCFCNEGFIQIDCSIEKKNAKFCQNDCNNNGLCDFETGKCVCKPGFIGVACEETTSKCPNNCNGNLGNCTEEGCKCVHPLKGKDCSQYICEENCYGNGVCLQNGKCLCNDGFEGEFCQKFVFFD